MTALRIVILGVLVGCDDYKCQDGVVYYLAEEGVWVKSSYYLGKECFKALKSEGE